MSPSRGRRRASTNRKGWAKFLASLVLTVLVLGGFSIPLGPLPPLGSLLDPTTGLWSVAFGSRQEASQTIHLHGLTDSVTIVRDTSGVPHIYAANAEDGWFALGYMHAMDRLWQMDIQYRAAAGRISEILGPSYVSTDQFFRSIGLARIAASAYQERLAAGDFDASVMQAYTAGVNAYVAGLDPPNYPIEFKLLGYKPEPWTPEKSLTEGGLIAWSLMGDFSDLEYNLLVEKFGAAQAAELFPSYEAGPQTPIQAASLPASGVPLLSEATVQDILAKAAASDRFLPQFEEVGSNNWAFAGTRTTTGKPLLAADPHLAFQLPAVWYWAELQAPPYHVRGASFPGVPAFFFGTNGAIAWGETNTGADVNDFFVETVNWTDDTYLYGGQWHPLIRYNEPITVKGGSVEPFTVYATVHGPILTRYNQTVSMESTITYFGQELRAMLGIDLAQNSDEFNASSTYWRVPAQNIIYADGNGVHGNIGIRSTGLYPIRADFTGRLPVDGSNASYQWAGFVPFDAYPHEWDPPGGFVSSNNQVPYPPGYPYADALGSFFDPGYRARRIAMLNETHPTVSFADLEAFQQDTYDVAASAFVPYILAAVTPSDGVEQLAYSALQNWTTGPGAFQATKTSVAETIWYTFLYLYLADTFGDEYRAAGAANLSLPQVNTLENLTELDPTSHWFDNVTTPGVETRDDILRQTFTQTVTNLTDRLGPTVASWTWESVHSRVFDHLSGLAALARGPYPSAGDDFTLNVAHGLMANGGPSWRQLIDFSNLDRSLAIYPGGQSGNPLSPHYADLLSLYLDGQYLPFRAAPTASSVPAGSVESTIVLAPG